jgi:hypothetical protein
MSFDEEARLSAEALGTHLSREIQERLQEFIGRLVDAAEQDRQAATERVEQALASARDEHRAALDRFQQDQDAANLRADQALSVAAQQRQVLADQAEQALAAAERTLQEAVARAREEAMTEATARFEAELADRSTRFEELFAERTSRFQAEHAERGARLEAAHAERVSQLDAEHAERSSRLDAEHAERTSRFETDHATRFAAEHAARLQADYNERVSRLEAEHAAKIEALQAERVSHASAAGSEREAALEREAIERQTAERELLAAGMRRLVNGCRKLDEGQSLSQLLDTLGTQAAAEAARCALFVVRGRALQGWSLAGFANAPSDPRAITIGLDVLPELARVVAQAHRAEVQTAVFASEAAEVLSFMNLPSVDTGVAVPVTVGGQVAALVYVDDGGREDRPVPATWPEAIELLVRHAGRCLEAQTAIRAARLSNANAAPAGPAPQPLRAVPSPVSQQPPAPAPLAATPVATPAVAVPTAPVASPSGMSDAYAEEHARRYARLLIADIRLYNEAAVRTGREQRDLAHRLQPEIARARHAFEERVPATVRQRERFFDEELVRTLADGDEALLGLESQGTQPESLAV